MEEIERIRLIMAASKELLDRIDAILEGRDLVQGQGQGQKSAKLLNYLQAAKMTGMCRSTVARMVYDGRLPVVEIRKGKKRIPEQAILDFIQGAKRIAS